MVKLFISEEVWQILLAMYVYLCALIFFEQIAWKIFIYNFRDYSVVKDDNMNYRCISIDVLIKKYCMLLLCREVQTQFIDLQRKAVGTNSVQQLQCYGLGETFFK